MGPIPAAPPALAAATVAAALLVACAGDPTPPDGPAGAPDTAATPGTAPGTAAAGSATEPGAGMLDFTAPTVAGGTVDVSSYAGRDLAIWFWAPW